MSEPSIDQQPVEDAQELSKPASTRPINRMLLWSVIGTLVGIFFAVDVITPGQTPNNLGSEWIFAVMIGVCIGQLNLIALWASLAPGNIVIRVSTSLLLTMTMWYGVILGNRVDDFDFLGLHHRRPDMTRANALLLIAILLIGVVILQVPLWIAKKRFRWRLTRRPGDADESLHEDRQFRLQHMLAATFLVAVALSPLQQILPPGENTLHIERQMLIMLPAVILCNLFIAIPCIWWAFMSTTALVRLLFGWLFYCALLTAIEFGSLCAILGPPGHEWMHVGFVFYVINVSQCAAILGTLLILRAIGFRMVRTPLPSAVDFAMSYH